MLNTETGASVEIRYIPETKQVSVIDIIRVVSGKNAQYARSTINRLDADFKTQFSYHRFPSVSRETPVATAEVIISLIWELPGKAAKEFRRQSARAVCQQLFNDLTLASRYESYQDEMRSFLQGGVRTESNLPAPAVSTETDTDTDMGGGQSPQTFPIPAAAPAVTAVASPAALVMEETERRQCVALTLKQMEQNMEIQRHKMAIERQECCQQSVEFYEKFRQNEHYRNDAKMRAVIQDNIMNFMAGNLSRSASTTTNSENDPWVSDFSTLLRERGVLFNNDMLGKLGKYVAQKHIEVYGVKNLDKTTKFVNGDNRFVAVYTKDKERFVNDCVDQFLAKAKREHTTNNNVVVPKLNLSRK